MSSIVIQKDRCSFLLGAGASAGLGIPTSFDLTKTLYDKVTTEYNAFSKLLAIVIAGLSLRKAVSGASPFDQINVEEVVSAVKLISERNRLEVSPFVNSWNPDIEELDKNVGQFKQGIHDAFSKFAAGIDKTVDSAAQRAVLTAIDEAKRKTSFSNFGVFSQVHGIDKHSIVSGSHSAAIAMSEVIGSQLKSHQGRGFLDLYTIMHALLVKIMWLDEHQVSEHLTGVISLGQTRNVDIFTLNYDNTIELAAKTNFVDCYDGFLTDGVFSGQWSESDKGINLYKLHGSVTWLSDEGVQLRKLHAKPDYGFMPTLIFGQREKLRDSGPFLDLLFEFKNKLKTQSQVCVVGYSFGDKHINKFLGQWLHQGGTSLVIANGPSFKIEQAQSALGHFAADKILNTG